MKISILAPKGSQETKRIYEILSNEFEIGDQLCINSNLESYEEEAENLADYLGIVIIEHPNATKHSDAVFILYPNGYELHINNKREKHNIEQIVTCELPINV